MELILRDLNTIKIILVTIGVFMAGICCELNSIRQKLK